MTEIPGASEVRRAGWVGLLCNLVLAAVKVVAGGVGREQVLDGHPAFAAVAAAIGAVIRGGVHEVRIAVVHGDRRDGGVIQGL